MKFVLSLFAILALGQLLFAQNTPWTGSGNVGIGTLNPTSPLQVVSTTSNLAQFKTAVTDNTAISVLNGTGQLNLGIGASTTAGYAWSNTGNFMIGNDGAPTVFVQGMGSGSVGINTLTPHYTFDVNGMMHTNNELVIEQSPSANAGEWLLGPAGVPANFIIQ
ncbi:MAG TPA: hypothetical protein VHI52_03875, partial [Verrucomicrobiae bacterium]|nr:hypothetical protein [Verrucomicrobiae bacterium]